MINDLLNIIKEYGNWTCLHKLNDVGNPPGQITDWSGNGNHLTVINGNPTEANALLPNGEKVVTFNDDGTYTFTQAFGAFNFDKFSGLFITKVPAPVWVDAATRMFFNVTDDANNGFFIQKLVAVNQIQFRYRANATDHNCTLSSYNPTDWCVYGFTVDNTTGIDLFAYDDGTWKTIGVAKTQNWTGDKTLTLAGSVIGGNLTAQNMIKADMGYFGLISDKVLIQTDFERIQRRLNI